MTEPERRGRPRTRTPTGPAAQIGAQIRARREAKGITQEQLADASGVTLRSIIDYEGGVAGVHGPAALKLQAIAQALGCTVDHLLSG